MRAAHKQTKAKQIQFCLRLKQAYEAALNSLPKGCLVTKHLKGHKYYYLAKREGRRVRYIYKGKISQGEINIYKQAKKYRAKYRKLLSQVKRKIKHLRGKGIGK